MLNDTAHNDAMNSNNPTTNPHGDASRRSLIKSALVVAAGLALSSNASSYRRIIGANERVRVGIVGFADRARQSTIPAIMNHAKELNFDIVAVSDIWNRRRAEGVEFLTKLTGHDITPARNNDELYAMKDVDATLISTADFQHARHCVEAVLAGRDVYVEKPLADTMEDARLVLNTVESSKQIVQIGTQRRSASNYKQANDYIRSGKFGAINMVEMSWNVNQPGRWRRPKLVAAIRAEDTDWNRYVLNRLEDGKKPEWNARKYIEYRLFFPYSTGIPDQWMVHQIDTVHWFTGYSRPRSVVANGGSLSGCVSWLSVSSMRISRRSNQIAPSVSPPCVAFKSSHRTSRLNKHSAISSSGTTDSSKHPNLRSKRAIVLFAAASMWLSVR